MSSLQKISLVLVLLAAGLQAGLHFFMSLGELPAVRREPLPVFVAHWQAVDHFMAARMPVVANLTLLFYLIALVLFFPTRSGLFAALVAGFLLSGFEVVYTVTQQLPVNKAIQALSPLRLTDPVAAEQLRQMTLAHFVLRDILSIAAFVVVVCAAVFVGTPQRLPS